VTCPRSQLDKAIARSHSGAAQALAGTVLVLTDLQKLRQIAEREVQLAMIAHKKIEDPKTSAADIKRLCGIERCRLTAIQELLRDWNPTKEDVPAHSECVRKIEIFPQHINTAFDHADAGHRQDGSSPSVDKIKAPEKIVAGKN